MKQKIMICEPVPGKAPRIIKTVTLEVHLDKVDFETFVFYKGQSYRVQGNCFFPFIIIDPKPTK